MKKLINAVKKYFKTIDWSIQSTTDEDNAI